MKIPCPDCSGNGFISALVDGRAYKGLLSIQCSRCKGAGEVDPKSELWLKIGSTHRTWRIAQFEGLAECAARLGIAERELGDMEHGRQDPLPLLNDIPETLRKYENLPQPKPESKS